MAVRDARPSPMTSETDLPPTDPPAPRRLHWVWTRPRAIAVAVVVVLGLTCSGLLIAKAAMPSVLPDSWTAADDATTRDGEVSIAARTFVLTFLTYDYRTMEEDVDALKEFATGTFKADFDAYEAQLTQLAKTQKSVSTGEVLRVGIGTATGDSVVVDVAATKVEESGVAAEGEPEAKTTTATRQLYLHITLNREGDRWLVAELSVGRVA